jgi:Ca2+-binding EF-hand superfamily protein
MVSGISGSQNVDMSAMWQDLLKKADKDGDGRISKAEFQAASPQGNSSATDDLFKKLDTNGDGYIDASENAAAAQKMHRGHHHRQNATDPLQVFEKADKDHDGKISKDDFKSALPAGTDSATANQVFDSMDTNQDGIVDASEYMAAMEKMGQFTQLFPQQGLSTWA